MQHFGAIYENVSKCKFEESLLDILKMCTSHPDQCQVSVLLQNLSKNVFVLVGKATSLAETFKGFPSSENDEFREQMKELGQDTGTFIRVIFNYEKRDDDYQQPQIQPEEPKHEDPKPVEPKQEDKPKEPEQPKEPEHHDEPKKEDDKPVPKKEKVILLEATYGPKSIMDEVIKAYKEGKRDFMADNNVWGDTAPGQSKSLHIKWSVKGQE